MAKRRDRRMATRPKRKKRLNKNDWMALSMDVLSQEGGAKLNVNNLCLELGVTKGSFYAHFKSREDFVSQLATYWAETYTQSVVIAINELEGSTAEARLLGLMRFLHQKRSGRFDVAIRAWSAQEPIIAQAVRKIDAQRFDYVQRIFHDMGFRGSELNLRTSTFVVFHRSEEGMRLPSSRVKADEEIRLRHAFFTRA